MDAIDIERKAIVDADRNIYLYNPLSVDFECKYNGISYTIPSRENKSFKYVIANHLGKHLVTAYMNTKPPEYSIEKAKKLIFP